MNIKTLRRLCRESFASFLTFVFDFPLADLHKQWCTLLETKRKILILSPRAHGKSSVVSIAYPCWRIGLNTNIRIKIVANSNEKAKELLSAITQTLLFSPKYRAIFPHVRPSKARYWTKERIFVERSLALRDATVEGKGIIATGTGGRSDLLICDDICDNRTAATKGMIRKVKEAFFDVWMNTLEPQGHQVVVIGTTWAEEDVYADLLRKKGWCRKIWKINENFDPLWPQVWPREKLYDKWKDDPLAFEKGFRMQPIRVETVLFSRECFKQRHDWPLTPGSNPPEYTSLTEPYVRKYMGVDISGGHGKDYSVLFTTGVHAETRMRWPINIIRVKAAAPEVARLLIREYEKYKPEVILVESNATQQMLFDWVGELRKLPIKSYYTGTQKHYVNVGIPSLRVELDNNMWHIPYWSHDPGCECSFCAWKREVLSYPYSTYDDCVMAWWFTREAIRLYFEGMGRGGYAVIEL